MGKQTKTHLFPKKSGNLEDSQVECNVSCLEVEFLLNTNSVT